MMRALYIFIALSLWMGTPIAAQDFAADMKRCSQAYRELSEYHLKASISVYGAKGNQKPVFTQETQFHKQGSLVRYEMESMLILQNEEASIWVDEQGKEIFCQEQESTGKKAKADELLNLNIDSLLQQQEGVSYLGMEKGLKHYSIKGQQGEIRQSELYLNPQTFLLERMEYQYAENPMGEAYYAIVEFSEVPRISDAAYSISEYVSYDKKTGFTLKPKYSSYQLTLRKAPFEGNRK